MEVNNASLCFPDSEKTCFACCPPIRPARYEHIQHKNIIRRILGENTSLFDSCSSAVRPITGYSCWALGYLDRNCRLVGCLLHPARNGGADLRVRVDYGNKCRRESCQAAVIFSSLNPEQRRFWLHLADGLDAFSYSSRKYNPLFTMMEWGDQLLGVIADGESGIAFSWSEFLERYPFFSSGISPKANAYLMNRLIRGMTLDPLRTVPFRQGFEHFSQYIGNRVTEEFRPPGAGDPVHRLDLDRHFLNFLRLSAGIQRIHMEDALHLKGIVDRELDLFKRRALP